MIPWAMADGLVNSSVLVPLALALDHDSVGRAPLLVIGVGVVAVVKDVHTPLHLHLHLA
jgi:hypothetical protein